MSSRRLSVAKVVQRHTWSPHLCLEEGVREEVRGGGRKRREQRGLELLTHAVDPVLIQFEALIAEALSPFVSSLADLLAASVGGGLGEVCCFLFIDVVVVVVFVVVVVVVVVVSDLCVFFFLIIFLS
ncbi:hypothetical protein E2C01_085051 [Portunus trituberculatus]|uniref:Uncharacterized protein n=1 Tax=Portunus trituberculatus TaxID=210409 RepID=A0A5B7JCI6_PORTR|nr:hypothetical protein [Portunus trituberculatus]